MQCHYVTSYPTSIALAAEIVNSVTAIGCVHIAESVGSRRELVANSCTHRRRRRDATKQFRRVGVRGVYWALEQVLWSHNWIWLEKILQRYNVT